MIDWGSSIRLVYERSYLRVLRKKKNEEPHWDYCNPTHLHIDLSKSFTIRIRCTWLSDACLFTGDDRARTGNLRLAKPALSQLSYVPRTQYTRFCDQGLPRIWDGSPQYRIRDHSRMTVRPNPIANQSQEWARVDSNYRPHAYQACALTN